MILTKIQKKSKLTSQKEKIAQLGEDAEKLSMVEITAMVKEVRQRLS